MTPALRTLLFTGVACTLAIAGDAAAETKVDKTIAFQQRLDDAAHIIENSPQMRGLPQKRRRAMVEFVAGNMLFAMLHEMGHVHISEMGLPVLGREEDAADSFAAVTMLKIGTHYSYDVLVEATLGWFLSAYRDEKHGEKLAFYDEHGLDKQRAYQIVCLMVGADMQKFGALATRINLPSERQDTCLGDYSNASWSWDTLLKPHRRDSMQPKTEMKVFYGDAPENLKIYEQTFRAVQLLEMVAYHISDQYVWRRPFTLEMVSCGDSGAYWNQGTAKLTLCYELAAEFANLFNRYGEAIRLPMYQESASTAP